MVEAAKIQQAGCELALEQIAYDMQLLSNFRVKVTDRVAAPYHQLCQWRKDRSEAGDRVAAAFLKEHVIIIGGADSERWRVRYIQFKEDIDKSLGVGINAICGIGCAELDGSVHSQFERPQSPRINDGRPDERGTDKQPWLDPHACLQLQAEHVVGD